MTNRTPEEIARLTEAQRRVLARMPGTFGSCRGRAGKCLTEKGLVEPCHRYVYRHVLTPLGLAVRSHLESHKP